MNNWWLSGGICLLLSLSFEAQDELGWALVWAIAALICWFVGVIESGRR